MAKYRVAPARSMMPMPARTPSARARQAAIADARFAARRRYAQGVEEEEDDEEEDEIIEEARRRAALRRAAMRRRAQEVKKDEEPEDPEEGDEDENVPPADIEPKDEEKEARRRAAKRAALRRRAMMRRAEAEEKREEPEEDDDDEKAKEARRRAYLRAAKTRRRAAESPEDLTGPEGDSSDIEELKAPKEVSDDLVETGEGKGGVQQTPPPSVDEAEEKVLAAYNLIEKQIAQSVISANVRKASLASEYCKQYTVREMKFAAEQLSKVGSAGKTAGAVRVAKRSAMPAVKPAAKSEGAFDSQMLFY